MIDILMAVYNGEKFLAEQIESILGQDADGWRLIICDDGSTDGSFKIAQSYAEKYPELVKACKNSVPSGSACANFIGMLEKTSAEYVMFSDQDDVWKPQKVRLTFSEMKRLEKEYGDVPLLVHTEAEIVDAELNTLKPRFTAFQGLNPDYRSLNRLLAQNNVTGHTAMINRRLAELLTGAPPEKMLMHDWWAALAAAAFGQIGFVNEPLSRYRQHGSNQLGAVNNRSAAGIIRIISQRAGTKKRVSATYAQAAAFLDFYRGKLPENARKTLGIYTDIPNRNKLKRAFLLVKHGFLKQNFITAVGQLIFC